MNSVKQSNLEPYYIDKFQTYESELRINDNDVRNQLESQRKKDNRNIMSESWFNARTLALEEMGQISRGLSRNFDMINSMHDVVNLCEEIFNLDSRH